MKIRQVGDTLSHADGQTDGRPDGQTDTTQLMVAFHNFVHASKGQVVRAWQYSCSECSAKCEHTHTRWNNSNSACEMYCIAESVSNDNITNELTVSDTSVCLHSFTLEDLRFSQR
jgi:hypothetical protein